MGLETRAMLARLHIRQWTGRKLDRQATREVCQQHGADADAGRFNKALVAKNALAAIKKTAGAARTEFYRLTLPWQDDGAHILPAAAFMEFRKAMLKLESDFRQAVADFCADYPAYVGQAEISLNGLFKRQDYPVPSAVADRFDWQVSIDPLPAQADFRVDLSAEETARIRADIETRGQAAQAAAMRDLWQRLYDVVSHMADRLTAQGDDGKPAVFRDSLVGNVQDLVRILPALNIAQDPDLSAMRQRVETALAGRKAQELRDNPVERAQTAQAAQQIAADMAAFMGGAPTSP